MRTKEKLREKEEKLVEVEAAHVRSLRKAKIEELKQRKKMHLEEIKHGEKLL